LTEEKKMLNMADLEFDSEFGGGEDEDDGTEEKE
jgi:hypothetical protein